MLVVKVELHNSNTGKVSEIARSVIYNTGTGTNDLGDYEAFSINGEGAEALHTGMVLALMRLPFDDPSPSIDRTGEVTSYERKTRHVWDLVSLALQAMGYGK
jgi:hypothetical protein